MTVHLCTLPHTDVDATWSTCAFTQKVRHLARMLVSQGQRVVVYGSDVWDHAGEHVVVYGQEDRARWFPGRDWRREVFDCWDLDAPCWRELAARTAAAVRERAEPGDVLSLTMGWAHQAVAAAVPEVLPVELGVGYEAVVPDGLHVFESRAWQHHCYGRLGINDGRYYDAVVPNAFDPAQFRVGPDRGYALFLGRMTERKGLDVVAAVAKHRRVLTAGQGDLRVPGAEHHGPVGPVVRAELLAGATVLLAPTGYVEPFGGVAVEAQLSGVPVAATPWGAFPETVEPGTSGWLCRRLDEFLAAVDQAPALRGQALRDRAVGRWGLDAVAPMYQDHLEHLGTLWRGGWWTGAVDVP